MSWFAPARGLSEHAEAALKRLAESGSSEAAAVADALNTIAANGEGSELNEHLAACAREIIGWAKAFLRQVDPEDPWEEDPDFPVADWQFEVQEDNTRQGYRAWAEHQREAMADEDPPSP